MEAYLYAACLRKGNEILILPAWRHTGKTHLALSLLSKGYDLISDDGILINKNGDIFPVSRNIHILYHNLNLILI